MSAGAARRIRRVLVALDASPGSVAAAASAARLAAALEAELMGLFVEDRDLLRLSESPQARYVGLTATAERLGAEQIERQLRAQAARARRTLSRLASEQGVTYTFRVARGRVASEILAAAAAEDLVSLGRIGWSRGPSRLGSTARALLARQPSTTLLADRGLVVAAPLAVLFDGSEAATEALRLAQRLARPGGSQVRVLATGPPAAEQVKHLLAEEEPRVVLLEGAIGRALQAAVHRLRPGLLILPIGGPGLVGDELLDLLARLRCPVLAVG